MLRFLKSTIVIASALSLALVSFAQDKAPDKKKDWKDRAEYDLYDSITKTQDANQWLSELDKWNSQYPQSDYSDLRRQLYLETYRSLNRPRDAFNAALDVLKDNPNNLIALSAVVQYIYQLVPPGTLQLTPQMTTDLEVAEKAAMRLLAESDAIYSKDNRPANMTDDQATQGKAAMKVFAQKTLGYVALQRKDYEKAQVEFTRTLLLDPNQAQVSYWLGSAVLAQNKAKPELQPVALYDFARAAGYSGPGSLPASDRKQVQDYLSRVYAQYHGSSEGLDKLLATASNSPLPPPGFVIKSKSDMERDRLDAEEATARANPMLALWRSIKKELLGDGGPSYFETSMKGFALPANVNGVTKFKGTLVSTNPDVRPRELVLAVENPNTPDVRIKLDSPLPGKMDPGAEISFDGVADQYTKDPFMVTFNVEKSHIEGWTPSGAPSNSKKGSSMKKSGGAPD